jgi:hypothetical protein
VLGATDDIQAILDDQIVKIQSMRASPFIKPFAERATLWDDLMVTLQDLLDNWQTCQSTWQYLEPIFGSEDIMKQMPEEGQKFLAVDQIYRDMMAKAIGTHLLTVSYSTGFPATEVHRRCRTDKKVANRSVRDFGWGMSSRRRFKTPADFPLPDWSPCRLLHVRRESLGVVPRPRTIFCRPVPNPTRFSPLNGANLAIQHSVSTANPLALVIARDKEQLELLVEANNMLDQIQKGLAAYLEVKRIAFPRFFFLSNDEMLEILSETKDPTKVQPHLKKCFEGINTLRFEPNTDISGMLSVEGELVPFASTVQPSKTGGAVEKWLVMVEAAMVEALNDVVKKSVADYQAKARNDWCILWPGQVSSPPQHVTPGLDLRGSLTENMWSVLGWGQWGGWTRGDLSLHTRTSDQMGAAVAAAAPHEPQVGN